MFLPFLGQPYGLHAYCVCVSVFVERNKMHLCATFLWVLCALWDVSLESTPMSVFKEEVFFKVKGAPVHVYSIYSHFCLTPLPPWGKQLLLMHSLTWIAQSSSLGSASPKTSPEWSSLKLGHLAPCWQQLGSECPAVFSPDADRMQPRSHQCCVSSNVFSSFFLWVLRMWNTGASEAAIWFTMGNIHRQPCICQTA